MAYGQEGNKRSYFSAVDLSADGAGQYRGVKLDANGKVVLCGLADVDFLGVLMDDPGVDESATVIVRDAVKVAAGAAVARNADVTTDANGRFITAVAGQWSVGIATEAAGAVVGTLFTVELRPGRIMP